MPSAGVDMPVKSVIVAEPPVMSIDETMMLVAREKKGNVRWAALTSHLHPITSRKVLACEALALSLPAF